MSEACTGAAASRGAAGWLSLLAAAPTFAVMALLTHFGGGPPDTLCSTGTALHLRRHGPDVPADERLPFGALAEADRRPRLT